MVKVGIFIYCQSWTINLISMKAIGFVMLTIISTVACVVNTENKQALNQISSVT